MKRQYLEWCGRQDAGPIDETDQWVWARVLGSFDMYVMKGDQSVAPHLVGDGFWESWVSTWMWNNIGPGGVFYDIGAHTGYYSLLAMWAGAHFCSSFEPNPDYYEMMLATRERNQIGSRWRINNVAMSDQKGTATLYVPKHLTGSASFSPIDAKYDVTEIEVETARMDESFGSAGAGIHTFKIDAEGAEEKIWDGLIGYLNRWGSLIDRTRVLLEYTPGSYSGDFLDKLEDYAELAWINEDGQREPVSREWVLSQTDWVMLCLQP